MACQLNAGKERFQERPIVIVEVLSESTRRTDLGEKRDAYLLTPSLKVLIFAESNQARMLVYRRNAEGVFSAEEYSGLQSVVMLDEIEACLPTIELYEGIQFQAASKESQSITATFWPVRCYTSWNMKSRIVGGRFGGALSWLVLVVALGAGGWLYWKNKQGQTNTEVVRWVTVGTGDVEDAVTAQGKLESKEYVDVGTQVSGQLKKIHVEIGDTVKVGDLLAEIDPRIYQSKVLGDDARLKTLAAQLAEAEANLDLAGQKLERSKRLMQSNAINQEAVEQTEAEKKIAAAQVDAIKAQIEEMQSTLDGDKTNLEYTRIYAPIAGVVVLLDAKEGQTLNASQTAPRILQLADLDTMTVRAQVAEADVMKVKAGAPAYFTTLGMLDRRWEGIVRQVLPSPEVINEVVLYNVLIDVDNRDRQLMTGMSTQIFFVLGEVKGVPTLPMEALRKRLPKLDGEKGTAFQVQVEKAGGGTEERTVFAGLMNRTSAEIRDGLKPGDKIALAASSPQKGNQGGGRYGGGPRL